MTSDTIVTSIKGFDSDLSCRGFKFEIGETYEVEGTIVACYNGFHACPVDEHPLSVFDYYGPMSRFALVSQSGETDRVGNKLASSTITINAEIFLGDLTRRAVDWVFARATGNEGQHVAGDNEVASASGTQSTAIASGIQGAATASGTQSTAIASGIQGAATALGIQGAAVALGYRGAASALGDRGAASASGDRSAAIASGDRSAAIASGDRSAAIASGDNGAATASGWIGAAIASGYRGAATASGYRGAATTSGDHGAATASGDQGTATALGTRGAATASGKASVAIATSLNGRARGVNGTAICLVHRDADSNIVAIRASKIGENGVKPNVWYKLNEAGDFVECES